MFHTSWYSNLQQEQATFLPFSTGLGCYKPLSGSSFLLMVQGFQSIAWTQSNGPKHWRSTKTLSIHKAPTGRGPGRSQGNPYGVERSFPTTILARHYHKDGKPQPPTWQPPPAKAELGCPHSCPPSRSEFLPLGQGLTYDREGVCLAVPCQEVTAVSCKAVHALIKGIDEVSSEEAAPGHRWLAQSPFSTKGPWRERPHVSTAGTNSSDHCSPGEMRLQPSEIRLQGRTFHLKRH